VHTKADASQKKGERIMDNENLLAVSLDKLIEAKATTYMATIQMNLIWAARAFEATFGLTPDDIEMYEYGGNIFLKRCNVYVRAPHEYHMGEILRFAGEQRTSYPFEYRWHLGDSQVVSWDDLQAILQERIIKAYGKST